MRIKKYLDIDVLEAARRRIRHIYDIFDSVVVCCSWGKDSTVVASLCREVCEERGVKVKALFRDEELIPDSVIEHGMKIRELPWIDLKWFCVPLASTKFILGKTYSYIQWDRDREWVREKPDFSIKDDSRVYDQYTIDNYAASFYRGSVCFVTGIRADESLMRLRSVMNKPHEPYITAPDGAPRVRLAKPIYDWTENDVFKYLVEESGIGYASWYDRQFWSGMQLRVSTPLHSEQSKRLYKLRELDPEFYDRILRVFPEAQDQDRYWRDFDQEGHRARYGESIESVRSYIDDHFDDEGQHRKAVKMLEQCRTLHERNPEAYPVRHILDHFMCGRYKRQPLPVDKKKC